MTPAERRTLAVKQFPACGFQPADKKIWMP